MGLGAWRFFLAVLVAISHLWAGMIHGPAAYAVWAFFVLSGYLMTLVLTAKYGTEASGLRDYAFNRVLRIYPLYVVTFILGLLTLALLQSKGFDLTKLNPEFRPPATVADWFANLSMIFFLPRDGLPVPVASALFVEVGAYMLMPLFARSKSAAILAAIITFVANWQLSFSTDSFVLRYTGFATALFPFAVGSLCCHYYKELRAFAAPVPSVVAWFIFSAYWLVNPYWPWTYGLPASVLMSAWVVVSLADAKGNSVDRWAGDLTYPIYLLHTTVAAWLVPLFGFERRFEFFSVAFVLTLLVSWLLVIFVDRPIQRFKLQGSTRVLDDQQSMLMIASPDRRQRNGNSCAATAGGTA